jgi:hypothetical protein
MRPAPGPGKHRLLRRAVLDRLQSLRTGSLAALS